MKKILVSVLLFTCIPVAGAASCRAYTAASTGSQNGYNTAKQAADAWSQREDQVSSSLEECLGDISSLIMMPKFPSLGGLLNKVEQQVCQAAQGEINKYIPSTIDPWGDINLPGTTSVTLPVTSPVMADIPSMPTQTPQPDTATAATIPGTDSPSFSLN